MHPGYNKTLPQISSRLGSHLVSWDPVLRASKGELPGCVAVPVDSELDKELVAEKLAQMFVDGRTSNSGTPSVALIVGDGGSNARDPNANS